MNKDRKSILLLLSAQAIWPVRLEPRLRLRLVKPLRSVDLQSGDHVFYRLRVWVLNHAVGHLYSCLMGQRRVILPAASFHLNLARFTKSGFDAEQLGAGSGDYCSRI